MTGSALLGEPPATHDDKLIYEALVMLNGTGYYPLPSELLVTDRPPDDSNAAPLMTLIIVLMTLVIVFTAARIWAQLYRKKKHHVTFWMSHIFLFFSATTTLAYDSIVLYMYTQGCGGRHINYCTYVEIAQMFELIDVAQSIFYFAVYCAKLSIICFLRGVVEHTVGWWNMANTIFFILVALLGLWSLLSTICTCVPVPAYFSLLILATTNPSSLKCLPETTLQVANRGLHIATDLCLFMFPLFLVWRVQISWKRKILFILPFTLGLVTVASSIVRNAEMKDIVSDVTWSIAKISVWDFIDINFSAMLMSMPFIMPLIDRAVRWYRQRSDKFNSGGTGSSYVELHTSRNSNKDNKKQPHNANENGNARELTATDDLSFHEFMIDVAHGTQTGDLHVTEEGVSEPV